jgi:hypothetical protein
MQRWNLPVGLTLLARHLLILRPIPPGLQTDPYSTADISNGLISLYSLHTQGTRKESLLVE